LMAFDSELEIDEGNYRRHLRYLLDTPGVTGITTNAHASEVATLTFEEQQRILEITLDEVAEAVPVVCGVYPGRNEQGSQDREVRRATGGRLPTCLSIHGL
jgi:4-hydroxy-tetrahydrodipicolinate synthase